MSVVIQHCFALNNYRVTLHKDLISKSAASRQLLNHVKSHYPSHAHGNKNHLRSRGNLHV